MKFNPLEVECKIKNVDGLPELKRLLAEHDRYFEYSDDFRIWRVGSEQRKEIKAVVKELGMAVVTEEAFVAVKNNNLKSFLKTL